MAEKVAIGGYVIAEEPIEINVGRKTLKIKVKNTGDRPVQVGSHFHFYESNRALDFDRKAAIGLRLNIPAGTAVRFEPGMEKEIELVELAGQKVAYGFNALCNGSVTSFRTVNRALFLGKLYGFKGVK